MVRTRFDYDSVIDESTDLGTFIPPNPGWNYVRLLSHPEDNREYSSFYCGKWLLFVKNEEFLDVFRKLAGLTKEYELTHCFKTLGNPDQKGLHVFCIYCSDCSDIAFVRKIGKKLNDLGYIKKYGYNYWGGNSAIYFKTDEATHYKSQSKGSSITLFRYMDDDSLYVKEFHDEKPAWVMVKSNNPHIIDNFQTYLQILETQGSESDYMSD